MTTIKSPTPEFAFPSHILDRVPLSRRLETEENLAWIKSSVKFNRRDCDVINAYDVAKARGGIGRRELDQKTRELLKQAFKLAEDLVPAAISAEIINREDFEDNYRPARILLQVLLEYVERQYCPAEADAQAVRLAQTLFAQIEVK